MNNDESLDLVWEVDEIARVIRRSPRQTINMLRQRALPAKKVAGRWCASRRALVDFFTLSTSKEAA